MLRGGYLLRALQSQGVAVQYYVSANGVTRYGLSHDAIKSVFLPIPPLPEQAAIVRFLDHIDRRIRRYIRATQKLIALLNEQKQAIIHRNVTRGLDPQVRLKPSGVEWLGDVPEHWQVLPIKRTFLSMDYGISDSGTGTGTIRLLTMGNIRDGQVTVPQDGGVSTVEPKLLLAPNDLLFNRTNSAHLVGKVGLFKGSTSKVTFASYLVRMRARAEHDPEYLNLVLNDHHVLSTARREAIPSLHQSNLNPTRYGRLKIPLPPLEEQHNILRQVEASTGNTNSAIRAAKKEVELLREYRVCLMSEVATGKLDVREAAARLPEQPGELEPLEEAEREPDTEDLELDSATEEAEA